MTERRARADDLWVRRLARLEGAEIRLVGPWIGNDDELGGRRRAAGDAASGAIDVLGPAVVDDDDGRQARRGLPEPGRHGRARPVAGDPAGRDVGRMRRLEVEVDPA